MKKLFYIPLFALFCACTNDELFVSETPVESSVNVSVSDFVNDDGTRTAFTETASGFSFSWSQGDQLGIFPDDNYQTCWTIKEISDAKNASFSGGSWQLVNGNTYYAYYPFSADNGTVQTPTISCDYTSQYISGLNSTSNIGDADYMYASATTAEDGKTNFALSHLGCVLKISLNLTEGRTYSKLKLSTASALIPAKSSFNIKSGSSTPSETVSSFDVDLANIKVTTSGSAAFYVMMPPCDLSSSGLTATLTYADGTEETSFTGKNMVAGKAYAYTASDLSATSAVGENQTYRIRGVNGIDYPYPEVVDLGLPSGTKWTVSDFPISMTCSVAKSFFESTGWSLPTQAQAQELWCNCTHDDYTSYATLTSKFNSNTISFPLIKSDFTSMITYDYEYADYWVSDCNNTVFRIYYRWGYCSGDIYERDYAISMLLHYINSDYDNIEIDNNYSCKVRLVKK